MRIPDQGIMPWSPESTTNRSTRTNIVWEGIALGIILERIAPKRKAQKTLPRIYGFMMVLARVIIFPTCPNMVWEGIVLGTILEKVKPREKPYQEYVDL